MTDTCRQLSAHWMRTGVRDSITYPCR